MSEKWQIIKKANVRYDMMTGEKREDVNYWISPTGTYQDSVALICEKYSWGEPEINRVGNLLAAAPEMLHALEVIAQSPQHEAAWKIVHNAIKTAKGEL